MHRTTLLLRVGILGAALAALAAPRLPARGRAEAPVLVVDVSASVGAAFEPVPGEDPWLAVGDGLRWLAPAARPTGLARGASLLGAALSEAAARHPGRNVLLVSDGRATDDAEAAARALAAQGGRVYARPAAPACADVGLLEAEADRRGTVVRVRAAWGASVAGGVRLTLRREGRIVAAREQALGAPGRSEAWLEDVQAPSEAATYRLELAPLPGTPDDDPGNDALSLGVPPERPAVLVWGVLDVEALRARAPTLGFQAPSAPERGDLAGADVVVLAGLPFGELGPAGTQALREFVAGGGTLLALGGPSAYGAGGWEGSALEQQLLPLRVRRAPERGADVVLALDASGSTHGEPLAALVRAAREMLSGLQPGERLAVLPFRGRAELAPLAGGFVAAGDAARRTALEAALDALASGGPTDLVAGIESAAALLGGSPPARERLVVLLTDGDPHEAPDEAGLARAGTALKASGVGFGALVVDMPVAVQALRRHVAARATDVLALDVPRGLAAALLEQMGRRRAAREQRRAGEPEALDLAAGSWAAELPRDWRPAWVHDVEAAEGARVLGRARWSAGGGGEVPFAAERSLGAGRSAALAWGPGAEPDPAAAAASLAPLLERLAAEVERGRSAGRDGAERIVVRIVEAEGRGRADLLADGELLELLEVEPGLFRSSAPCPEALDLRARGQGFEQRLLLPTRPPAEHRGVGPDLERLEALARAGGGRLLAPGERPAAPARSAGASLAPWLLLGACMLLAIERARG